MSRCGSAEAGILSLSPTRDVVQAVLTTVAPGSIARSVQPLAGSYSVVTHVVTASNPDGPLIRLVVRRYVPGDRALKSRIEYNALSFLQEADVPAPSPILLDDSGSILGTPGIVTRYVPGSQLMHPTDHPEGPAAWAQNPARMLVRIHSVPCDRAKGCVLDAEKEATWFLRSGPVPDYMAAHPDGRCVWQAVHDLWRHIEQTVSSLVHRNHWRGNALWNHGQITVVVDWEEAAYGDPGIDVAYCLMEMVIMGFIDEAAEFQSVYKAETGHPVANLTFWEG